MNSRTAFPCDCSGARIVVDQYVTLLNFIEFDLAGANNIGWNTAMTDKIGQRHQVASIHRRDDLRGWHIKLKDTSFVWLPYWFAAEHSGLKGVVARYKAMTG